MKPKRNRIQRANITMFCLTDVIYLLKERESPDNIVKIMQSFIATEDSYMQIRQEDRHGLFLFNLLMDKIIEEVCQSIAYTNDTFESIYVRWGYIGS